MGYSKQADPVRFSHELHAMRGLAASAVVVFHALLIFRAGPYDNPHRLPLDTGEGWLLFKQILIGVVNGHAAVILFFVLSGTVLALSLDRTQRLNTAGLASFYIRRCFRLFPLLIIISFVAALLHLYFFEDVEYEATTTWMGDYYRHVPTPREILANAVGLRNSLNAPAWTITVEIIASFMFPLLYILSLRNRFIVPTLLILTLVLFMPLPRDIPNYFLCFYLGALIPRLGSGAVAIYYGIPRFARLFALVLALLVMGWFERITTPDIHMAPLEVFAMTLAATFIVSIVYFGNDWRLLRSRFLMFAGEISYGIYLIHFGVLFLLAHLLAPHLPALEPREAIKLNLALGTVTLLVTIALATISYYGFEQPCQRLGRRFSIWFSQKMEAGSSGLAPGWGIPVMRFLRMRNGRGRPPRE